MFNRNNNKQKDTLSGDVLCLIESRLKKMVFNYILTFDICIGIGFILSVLYIHSIYKDYLITTLYMFLLFMCFGVILMFSYHFIHRGNPLIITTDGIIMKPYIFEYWNNLKGYDFITYDSLNRIALTKTGIGTSLILYNKGNIQRSINWKGHSIIATNGIFLNEDQIKIITDVFNKHNLIRGNI